MTEAETKRYIKPYKMFNGCLIPNWLLQMENISDGAKLCYGRLCQYAGKKDECYPKQLTLAEELGKGLSQTKDYLNELVDHKLIEKIRVGKRCSNRYKFLWHGAMVIAGNPTITNGDMIADKQPITQPENRLSHSRNPGYPIERESYKENHITTSSFKKDSFTPTGNSFSRSDLETNFGRIAKPADIKAFLSRYPENTHRAVGAFLAERYPEDGWRAFSRAKDELDRERVRN